MPARTALTSLFTDHDSLITPPPRPRSIDPSHDFDDDARARGWIRARHSPALERYLGEDLDAIASARAVCRPRPRRPTDRTNERTNERTNVTTD